MKYIASYDNNINENRTYVLAAVNKINYICKALNVLGEKIEIISAARTKNNKFYGGKIKTLADGITLKLFPTLPGSNAIFRRISLLFSQINLFLYMFMHVSKNEKVIVYHGLAYGNALHFAKKIKKFKVCLEVEEIYQDVKSLGARKNRREYRDIKEADMYIFPTKLLNNKINLENKPYAIIHGTYQVEKDRGVSFNDKKIHVVYAGTFDPRKGGALAAVAATEFLPENYHVHIIGFGSDKDTGHIRKIIDETNKKSKAKVTYDGLLSGEDYIQFLQKCQIGLSTQNPEAKFNDTSFPSKILSYMANGLRVVTIRIPAIETSDIGSDVYYYDKQDPKEIANTIINIDFKDGYNGRKRISMLNDRFIHDIKRFMTETNRR